MFKKTLRIFLTLILTCNFLVAAQPIYALNCNDEKIPRLNIFINPITFNRDDEVTLDVYGVPEAFRGNTFTFSLVLSDPSGDNPLVGGWFDQLSVTFDESGNYSGTFIPSANNQFIPEGQFGFAFTQPYVESSGLHVTQICNEGYGENDFLTLEGAAPTCIDQGEICDPDDTSQLLCRPALFCNAHRDPPRVQLPTMRNVIFNNANCEYLATNGFGCASENPTLPVACTEEIQGRVVATDFDLPVEFIRMCCSTAQQCGLALNPDGDGDDSQVATDPFSLCRQVSGEAERTACQLCLSRRDTEGGSGIWTAVGCISTEGNGIVQSLITIALGIAGGIGLLMIIASGALFALSRNDAKKVGDAKELLTSVIIGLIFIVFSVTILELIGVTILRIPGFGG